MLLFSTLGKIVPSRYKAAASSFKKPSSTLNATESRQERKSAKNKNVQKSLHDRGCNLNDYDVVMDIL